VFKIAYLTAELSTTEITIFPLLAILLYEEAGINFNNN